MATSGNGSGEVARLLNSRSRDAPPMKRSKPLKLSQIEELPTEVLQLIAAYIPDDSSFIRFARQTSTTLCHILLPQDSAAWRMRFLELYDYPNISDFNGFSLAWRFRQYVLGRGHDVNFRNPDAKTDLILKAIKNVVIEAFNPTPRLGSPEVSKSLAFLMSVPAPGTDSKDFPLHAFLSCAEIRVTPWTEQHELHAALRLTLGFLFLSPTASNYHRKLYDDEGYDLRRIYLAEADFSLIYDPQIGLDLVDLIHVLNFWSNHFCNRGVGSSYHGMALKLGQHGRSPKAWTAKLAEFNAVDMPNKWVGHFTCYHNPSKKQKSVWHHQTCAEDWTACDPLVLDFSLIDCTTESPSSMKSICWPMIFRELPCFHGSLNQTSRSHSQRFIRGFAHFQDIFSYPDMKGCGDLRMIYHHSNFRAYNALHLSGIVCPIAADHDKAGIPGFASVKMVMFRPTHSYILHCLWSFFSNVSESDEEKDGIKLLSPENRFMLNQLHQNEMTLTNFTPGQPYDPNAIDAVLFHVAALESFLDRVRLTHAEFVHIESLALDYGAANPYRLRWDDIEYSYAYEGVLTPGGKLMLGRWFKLDVNQLWQYDNDLRGGPDGVRNGNYRTDYGIEKDDIGGFVFWAEE